MEHAVDLFDPGTLSSMYDCCSGPEELVVRWFEVEEQQSRQIATKNNSRCGRRGQQYGFSSSESHGEILRLLVVRVHPGKPSVEVVDGCVGISMRPRLTSICQWCWMTDERCLRREDGGLCFIVATLT